MEHLNSFFDRFPAEFNVDVASFKAVAIDPTKAGLAAKTNKEVNALEKMKIALFNQTATDILRATAKMYRKYVLPFQVLRLGFKLTHLFEAGVGEEHQMVQHFTSVEFATECAIGLAIAFTAAEFIQIAGKDPLEDLIKSRDEEDDRNQIDRIG